MSSPAEEEPLFLATPRNVEPLVTDLLLQVNLESGRHIHLLDQDGDWCLDGRCPTSTDVQGISAPDDD